jgi:hypothetical protein
VLSESSVDLSNCSAEGIEGIRRVDGVVDRQQAEDMEHALSLRSDVNRRVDGSGIHSEAGDCDGCCSRNLAICSSLDDDREATK